MISALFHRFRALAVCGATSLLLLGGCASTGDPRDPLEPINRGIYHFNDGVDHLLLKPAAEIYRGVLPDFVRTGVRNFFSNINDVLVALNNLLQGKVPNAASDVGRVVVNSTVGLLGVLDVASDFGLEKHNEDFGQTLGYWGVGDGPYLVLPFIGPSNFRDAAGWFVDYKTDLITYVEPPSDRNILWGLRLISRRTDLLDASKVLETAALDPYEFLRDAYLQRRRNLIYDGNPPPEKDKDDQSMMQPGGGERQNVSLARSAPGSDAVISTWVGGDNRDLTPARLEALQARAQPEADQLRAGKPAAQAPQNHVVRFWSAAPAR